MDPNPIPFESGIVPRGQKIAIEFAGSLQEKAEFDQFVAHDAGGRGSATGVFADEPVHDAAGKEVVGRDDHVADAQTPAHPLGSFDVRLRAAAGPLFPHPGRDADDLEPLFLQDCRRDGAVRSPAECGGDTEAARRWRGAVGHSEEPEHGIGAPAGPPPTTRTSGSATMGIGRPGSMSMAVMRAPEKGERKSGKRRTRERNRRHRRGHKRERSRVRSAWQRQRRRSAGGDG